MRLRPPTIRTQLLALLLVPMVTLAGLWTYSSFTTVRGALVLIRLPGTYRYYGTPVSGLTEALQRERLAAVEYTASGGRFGGADFDRLCHVTDDRVATVRDHARRRADSSVLTSEQDDRISELLAALDGLARLRAQVAARRTNWSEILDRYSALIDPGFRLRTSLTTLQGGEAARKGAVLTELVRARELLSREDAMMTGGRIAGGMTDGQYRDFLGTVDGRRLLHEIYEPELPATDAADLDRFENGSTGWALYAMEETARTSTPLTATAGVRAGVWRRTVDTALDQLSAVNAGAAQHVGEQARATGMSVLLRAAVVSVAGLFAVLAALLISLRISRRIATRLTTLRDAAEELSGRRLPELMRRLREAGPAEDVEALADSTAADGHRAVLWLGDDEIGQVGRAFGVAQRAAVQAAVEQARLRRGVAAVFTTLARRSQVLLHRQLTLLDAMERRTQDPAELADLFRLDHMTTRMRRHAEGLLILSGDTPGRAWRRPVRLGDVVSAAVGEVEDYRRVAVRRMPRVALAGGAVGDVVHLLAELLENAASFSPPGTPVVVDARPVSGGYVVEIEDRGLGMSPERIAECNRELRAAAGSADLPETDRLGLFTVGRLAARHGVRVTLGRGSGEGTVAVVLLPDALLLPVEENHGTGHDNDEPGECGTDREVAREYVPLAERVPVGVAENAPGNATRVAEGASWGDTVLRDAAAEPSGPSTSTTSAPAGAGRAGPQPAGSPTTTTAAGLPRRTPNRGRAPRSAERPEGGRGPAHANGSDPLAVSRGADRPRAASSMDTEPGADPAKREDSVGKRAEVAEGSDRAQRERSPEAARSTVAAFTRGLARGRSQTAVRTTSREEDGGST